MKQRFYNLKIFKLLTSENKKKRALSVFVLLLLVSVICEIFVFNFKFWGSVTSEELSLAPSQINGGLKLDGDRYRIYKNDAFIEYSDINSKIKYMRISPETGYDTIVKFHATDEGNEFPLSVPQRTINTHIKQSQYIRLHYSGKVDTLKIELKNTVGTIINLSDITLNAKVPMMFSFVRVLLMTLSLMLLYLLRPCSSVYNIKTNLKNKNQRLFAVIFAIVQTGVFAAMTNINFDATNWDKTEVHHRQYYNLIEAFKNGELSIGEGDITLNAMENPYDFHARVENEVVFNWDNAYYDGKYYSYFGVLPAILLHLPYNLITGSDLPNQIAVIIFATALIAGIMLLLWEIIKKWYKNTPFVLYLLLSVVFSVVSSLFYAAYKPDFYMVPPLAGLALSVWGLSMWLNAQKDDKTIKTGRIMWGALFIALTSMCRPQFLITLFFGVLLFWRAVFKDRTLFSRTSAKQTLALCLPIILVALAAMWYNYARFGSPLDFGANYNLTTNDMTKRGIVLGRTGLGIFTYFFQPMRIDAQFPFINDFDPATVYQGITITEKQIGGAFIIFPVLLFALRGLLKKDRFNDKNAYNMLCLSIGMAFTVAVLDTQMAGILMRYFTDFIWLLMIASVITVFATYEMFEKAGSTLELTRFKKLVVALCLVSLTVAFLSIFAHSKNAVWWSNSIGYNYIKHLVAFWL